jgi:hypothetical protein
MLIVNFELAVHIQCEETERRTDEVDKGICAKKSCLVQRRSRTGQTCRVAQGVVTRKHGRGLVNWARRLSEVHAFVFCLS